MTTEEQNSVSTDPIKDATLGALQRMLDPLIELMLDTGVTVQEVNQTLRHQAITAATRRVVNETGRENRSRVSIMTGLPRSEISKTLNRSHLGRRKIRRDLHPARRVLAAWFDSPQFAEPNGEPAILPIFGRKRSFERLVAKHGGGIPVRAMLDELTQMNAVKRIADQQVRAISRVPILTGLTSRSIVSVGEKGKDLLTTLTHNIYSSEQPLFEATAVIEDADPAKEALIRRELSEQGSTFISAATSLLNRSRQRNNQGSECANGLRLGVTIFYFQEEISSIANSKDVDAQTQRKNLKRAASPSIPKSQNRKPVD